MIKFPTATICYTGDIEITHEVKDWEFGEVHEMINRRSGTPLLRLILKSGDNTLTFSNLHMDTGWRRV